MTINHKIIFLIRVFTLVALLAVTGLLLYLNTKPNRVYSEDFTGLQSPISGPFDANQSKFTKKFKDGALVMDENQFYFNVFLNEIFDKAIFRIKFKNENSVQFDLRAPIDKSIADAVSYPLEQKQIDILKNSPDWIYLQDKSTVLLQKRANKRHYDSIDEFLREMPATKKDRDIAAEFGDYRFAKDVNTSQTQIVLLNRNTDFDKIDYIIGRYAPLNREGDWKVSEYELVIPETFRKKNIDFPVFLEAPNLESEQNEIIIDSIEIKLEKPVMTLAQKAAVFFQQFSMSRENIIKVK